MRPTDALKISLLCTSLIAAPACSAMEDRPSLLPALKEAKPRIDCVSQAETRESALECVPSLKAAARLNLEGRPKTAKEHISVLLGGWVFLGTGSGRVITEGRYQEILGYAECIENAAYSSEFIDGRTNASLKNAKEQVASACSTHPFSMLSFHKRYPQLLTGEASAKLPDDAAEFLLAEIVREATFQHVVDANDWNSEDPEPAWKSPPAPPPPPPSLEWQSNQ